jgi:hypothetical protein
MLPIGPIRELPNFGMIKPALTDTATINNVKGIWTFAVTIASPPNPTGGGLAMQYIC